MADDIERAKHAVENWHLGQTSASHESGNGGAGIISTGKGDHGGVSYGTYQLSTTTGTLKEYLDQSSFGPRFNGLTPATPAFDAQWKELAKTDQGFATDQQTFIGKSHYDVEKNALKAEGIDLSGRGRAVQDALWSTSVQFRNLTPTIFAKGLEEKFGKGYELSKLSDKDIVEAAQDYKVSHNSSLFKSSPDLQLALLKRANTEKAELLQLASSEELLTKNGIDIKMPSGVATVIAKPSQREVLEQGHHGQAIKALQIELSHLGYTDARGHMLKTDGDVGANTKHAVEVFQRDHHLAVDGIAGPKTLNAINQQTQTRKAAGLDSPANPDHALYLQAQKAVYALDARRGRASDQQSNNLAAALTVAAKREGLGKIDQVALSEDGSRAFAVQNGVFKQTAQVQTDDAVHTPFAQSGQALQQMVAKQPDHAQVPAPAQTAPAFNA
jgi:hypothetical protein